MRHKNSIDIIYSLVGNLAIRWNFGKILIMLKIKLQRVGRKHDPSFRVVITDRRTGPKSKKHVAQVGFYDAIRKKTILEKEVILDWISKGAQPTDTVYNILVSEGVIKGKKKNVLPKKSPIIDEEALAKAKEEEEKKKAEEEAKKAEAQAAEEAAKKEAEEEAKEEVEGKKD